MDSYKGGLNIKIIIFADCGNEGAHLSTEALPDKIIQMLRNNQRVWKSIGTELGIDKDILNSIEEENKQCPNCLQALIEQIQRSSITHDAIIQSLESERVINAVKGMSMITAVSRASAQVLIFVTQMESAHSRVSAQAGFL